MTVKSKILLIGLLGLILLTNFIRSEYQSCVDHYGDLISLIYSHFPSSGVYLVSPETKSYEWYSLTANLIKTLSVNQIFWLTIKYKDIVTYSVDKMDANSILRPLIVFPVNSFEDIKNLNEIQICIDEYEEYNDINRAYFLLLFSSSNSSSIYQQCYEPSDFNIKFRFNSEIFVWCCDDPSYLYQWYSINGKNILIENFGNLNSPIVDTEFSDNRPYFLRRNLQNNTLKLSMTINSMLFNLDKNDNTEGFLSDVIDELSYLMNFTQEIYQIDEKFGGFDTVQEKWIGVIGNIYHNDSDLGVAGFSMTSERLGILKFTHTLFSSELKLFYKLPDMILIEWDNYFRVLSFNIWIVIIALILISTIVLTIIQYKRTNNYFVHSIVEKWLNVWGIFCQQGLPKFPNDFPTQIVYISMFTTSIIVLAAYSAALISFLTFLTPDIPFNTIEEFVQDNTYFLIVLKDSAEYYTLYSNNEHDFSITRMAEHLVTRESLLPLTIHEAITKVCEGWATLYISEKIINSVDKLPCWMMKIDDGYHDNIGMILSNTSPYVKLINYHLVRFRSNGMLNRLDKKYLSRIIDPKDDSYQPVTFYGIFPIFIILLGGIIASMIILVTENIYYVTKYEFLPDKNMSRETKK